MDRTVAPLPKHLSTIRTPGATQLEMNRLNMSASARFRAHYLATDFTLETLVVTNGILYVYDVVLQVALQFL